MHKKIYCLFLFFEAVFLTGIEIKTSAVNGFVLDVCVGGEAEYSHSFLMYPSLNMASRKTMSLNGERSRMTPWP